MTDSEASSFPALPGIRRAVPKFSRPAIDLGAGRQVKRGWKSVSPADLKPGDTVVDVGLLVWVSPMAVAGLVMVENVFESRATLEVAVPVKAFVPVDEG
jgi:hypothetical protein